jgi:beta-lactamase class A
MKTIIVVLLLISITSAKEKKEISVLRRQIASVLDTVQGTFAVAFKDLRTGRTLYMHEHENFHAASTMKVPVMVEVFNQAKAGKLSLNDSLPVINSFSSIIDRSEYSLSIDDDSEDSLYSTIGKKETIYNLVVKMITVSSNLSTNILIEKIGAGNVMNTMKKMGLNDIQVLRGVEDGKAFQAGKNNTTTAYDLSVLFEAIARKKAVSKKSSEQMTEILLAQKFNNMIPAKLPAHVKVAHKTGSITNLQHDAGIIYLPDGTMYILVVLSKNLSSNKEGISAIAEISKYVYDFMSK